MTVFNTLADFRQSQELLSCGRCERLPDVGFLIVPEIDFPFLPNLIMIIVGGATFTLILSHPKRIMVIRRLLVIYTFLLLCRSLCIVATALPDPSPACIKQRIHLIQVLNGSLPQSPDFGGSLWRGLTQTVVPIMTTTCGDLIFSGHTVFFALCGLIWSKYCS